MMTFLFDVDGTLTDARKPIDPKFKDFMIEFISNNKCMIVTGSDRSKTVEQIGLELTNALYLEPNHLDHFFSNSKTFFDAVNLGSFFKKLITFFKSSLVIFSCIKRCFIFQLLYKIWLPDSSILKLTILYFDNFFNSFFF